ncbi:uncharacterized protein LOC122242338 [Penaeus japonicus]|uniref:uncharacterized protein LOC122242338 n=1 Tax=Penaeus japonicus TaxID=27405 RepID=UPI001C713FA7|nr:uncharacterized protein LOC122242338 [Penaeus japonicus]
MVMTKVLFLVLGVMVTGSLRAEAVERVVPAGHPAYPGRCVANGKFVDVGISLNEPGCVKVECRSTNTGLKLVYTSCDEVRPKSGCGLHREPEGEYPYCCLRPDC